MRILFQGDSITDAGRFEDEKGVGWGYPLYASELIKNRHPEIEFEFINRGISGHKVSDLAARWQQDCIDLQPDVVSILIGVNDTWHHAENRNWIPNEEFEAAYRGLLTDIKEKTNAKIIILEQFLIPVEDKEFFRKFRSQESLRANLQMHLFPPTCFLLLIMLESSLLFGLLTVFTPRKPARD